MKVNHSRIKERFGDLVKFEGYLPNLLRPLGFPIREYYKNIESLGLYEEVKEKEFRTRRYSYLEDVKELEDFIQENPQFKDFITYDVTDGIEGPVDDSHPWVDYVYATLVGDELVVLDDFVPPMFFQPSFIAKRNLWLKENKKEDIILSNKEYKKQLFLLEGSEERTIYIMQCMQDFIDDYPEYSGILVSVDAFKKHLWKLKKELHENDSD